ncbi:MAG: hypothetical protein LBS82_03860 [Spirochaetaceae bacterium]|nr:hypothetical protein [Spirochaetaceae bacterium]
MSGRFFDAAKALFPRGHAFELFVDNNKRKLVDALSELPENVRAEAESAYLDLFPDTTRFPEKWESVFSIYLTREEYAKRRNIVDALWKTISGDQGTAFLQQVLRSVDERFTVAENVPATDPRNKQSAGLAICDYETMLCDNEGACCDYFRGDDSFLPGILQNDKTDLYSIPDDSRFWETCFFVCKEVYRNNAHEILYIEPFELAAVWRDIVEYLILKIKPVHGTAVVFVKWTEEAAA